MVYIEEVTEDEALDLKEKGNAAFKRQDFAEAERLFTEALQLASAQLLLSAIEIISSVIIFALVTFFRLTSKASPPGFFQTVPQSRRAEKKKEKKEQTPANLEVKEDVFFYLFFSDPFEVSPGQKERGGNCPLYFNITFLRVSASGKRARRAELRVQVRDRDPRGSPGPPSLPGLPRRKPLLCPDGFARAIDGARLRGEF